MVLEYYRPSEIFTWDELDTYTDKVDGMWTWPLAGMVWLDSIGFEIANIESFDYRFFVRDPHTYLKDYYGAEVAAAQEEHSNIAREVSHALKLLETLPSTLMQDLPTLELLKHYLDRGYLLICNVNSHVLHQRLGYTGHFVLVYGYSDDELFLHDPGLPGQASVHVSYDVFESAWSYPDKRARNMLTVRERAVRPR